MNNCILIPSYKLHFSFVNKLLISIDKFNQDKNITEVYVIINKNENVEFYNQIKIDFKTINITVLFLEEIIFSLFFEIKKSQENIFEAENLLEYCGKFTFQSIKKILGLKYLIAELNYNLVYVLDSEGYFFRPFSIELIFKKFIENKTIFYNSKQRINSHQSNISKEILNANIQVPGWLLENYLWIYEKNIIIDFFNSIFINISKPIDISKCLRRDIFIEIVYYHFIFINNKKYNYNFIDTYESLKMYINKEMLDNLVLLDICLLEDIRWFISGKPELINNISDFFKDFDIFNFKIAVNESNINFIKNTESIICINSGDFPLSFELKF